MIPHLCSDVGHGVRGLGQANVCVVGSRLSIGGVVIAPQLHEWTQAYESHACMAYNVTAPTCQQACKGVSKHEGA